MIYLKKLWRPLRIILLALMLAVCMVLGVAPVIPKRKEPFSIEIKAETTPEEEEDTKTTVWQARR